MRAATATVSILTPPAVRVARSHVTILLVDDDAIVRELQQTVLSLSGYKVMTAVDGPCAIEVASRAKVDMLVTDFNMPEMDGVALAAALTVARNALPVLIVTAAGIEELPTEKLRQRRWNYLPKPVDNARLLNVVDRECLGWAMRPAPTFLQVA